MSAQGRHLRPTAALAPRALLAGDPGRCLTLATTLLDRPLMFNHARGLWGYTGLAADGEPLTIQATGLGAAGAAIVVGELCDLGLTTFVRVGSARSLHDHAPLTPGSVVAVDGALAGDGPSRALGAGLTVLPDPALTAALTAAAGASALVATGDLQRPGPAVAHAWARAGARASDLQTATVLQVARARGISAAAVVVVTGTVAPDDAGVDDETLAAAVLLAGQAAATALGIPPRTDAPLPPPRDDERAVEV